MSNNNYMLGQVVRIVGTVADLDGQPADPTTITLVVTDPAGVETTLTTEITRTSAGIYECDIDASARGYWNYKWVATGDYASAQDGGFYVR